MSIRPRSSTSPTWANGSTCRSTTVRADFTRVMAGKRAWIEKHWAADGVPAERIARALELMQPTGNPYLDLCLWKGRFPSRKAQFCTAELKANPLDQYTIGLMKAGFTVESWQGVRRDESQNRALACALEWQGLWLIRRPIAGWTAARVFRFAAARGIRPNPLYLQGMKRVGCMPCINCGKDDLLEISKRWPEEIARVAEWEKLVSWASKRGVTSFFCDSELDGETRDETFARLTIYSRVAWSQTSRGGRQQELERLMPAAECSSQYGLCE